LIPVLVLLVMMLLGWATDAEATGPGGWDHLGTGATAAVAALNGRVDALFAAAPNALYAGGVFTSAGGDSTAVSIARWDGSAWHSVGAPALNGGVDAIAVDGGKVYVGGPFTNAGGDPNADFVAVWDGASWKPVCPPVTANVKALQIIGRKLYIGGDFADGAGNTAADKLLVCDLDTGIPSATVNASDDINSAIYALTADTAGRLYAAGSFINMDQIPNADHVAMYDGTWHAMQAGAVDQITRSITSDGTNVYIGSDSVNIGGIAQADHVAKWNGSAWSALGSNTATTDGYFPASTFINGLATSGSTVYATGSFQNADGHPTADDVVGFNGFSWAPMGSDGAGNGPLPAQANAVALFGGQVVVGGNFTTAGGDGRASYIARYPGAAHPLTAVIQLGGGGFAPFVGSTATFDGTASTGDAPIVGYRWSFGDGSPDATTPTVAHVLTKQGQNTITLTVTDSLGHTAQASDDFFIAGMYPQARFTYLPTTVFAQDPIAFDASTSSDADGTIASYDWQWGDGTADDHTATATHAFAKPGTYQVAMFVRDDNTQSGAAIHNVAVLALVVPNVSHASVTNAKFRVGSAPTATTRASVGASFGFAARAAAKAPIGTSFKFELKAPAKVTIAISRSKAGVRRGKRCVARTPKTPRRAKSCTRAVKAGTLTRSHLHNGPNAIAFSGRIGTHALKPGKYKASLTASNAKGRAKPVTVKFTVVK
jgi:PKD repeat protein